MYSNNAQTFRCVDCHLNLFQADPNIHDLLARRIIFSMVSF